MKLKMIEDIMKTSRILGICGSPKKEQFSSSQFLLEKALEAAEEEGAVTKLIRLIDYNILACEGCGQCMNNQHCHLLAESEDELAVLFDECVAADGFIFASPVYALSLPSIWKNWIDRCEPCSDEDLQYGYYCYDVVQNVKGKAFKGKVAGQIAVAAGPGHEWALASLMPAFTAIKLSVIASVGLSLIEYDAQPGIKSKPWAKDIKDAKFAIDIARSVGKRVYEAIGYSTFLVDKQTCSSVVASEATFSFEGLVTFADIPFKTTDIETSYAVLFIAGQQASYGIKKLVNYIGEKVCSERHNISLINVVAVGQLPKFINKKFVKFKVKQNMPSILSVFDWELVFVERILFNYNSHNPCILLVDMKNMQIKLNFQEKITSENMQKLSLNILQLTSKGD